MAHKLHLSSFTNYSKIWIIPISKWKLDKICLIDFIYCTGCFKRNQEKEDKQKLKKNFFTIIFLKQKKGESLCGSPHPNLRL